MTETIADQLNRLSANVLSAYETLSSKGAAVPEDMTVSNLPSSIDALPDAGPVQDGWAIPPGWPDLRKILKDNPPPDSSAPYSLALLILVNEDGTVPTCGYSNGTIDRTKLSHLNFGNDGSHWKSFKTSDSEKIWYRDGDNKNIDSVLDVEIGWDPANYLENPYTGEKFVWVVMYWDQATIQKTYLGSSFDGTVWIHGDGNVNGLIEGRFARRLRAITGLEWMGSETTTGYNYELEETSLETVPPLNLPNAVSCCYDFDNTLLRKINFYEGGQPVSCRNWNNFLNDAKGIEEFPDILFEGNVVSNMTSFGSTCATLKSYPDVMDFTNVKVNPNSFWNYCSYLRQSVQKYPKRMIFPAAVSGTVTINQQGVIVPSDVASFDSDGNLTGGWLFGWERPSSVSTEISVQFGSTLSGPFTEDQVQAVKDCLSSHGFNLLKF